MKSKTKEKLNFRYSHNEPILEAFPDYRTYFIWDDFTVSISIDGDFSNIGKYESIYDALDAANEDYNKRRSV